MAIESKDSGYNPDDKVPGSSIRQGDVLWGDCFWGMPAVIVWGQEDTTERPDRHPETEEQWELYGATLPDTIPKRLEAEIGCVAYQELVKLALPIQIAGCASCPLNAISADT